MDLSKFNVEKMAEQGAWLDLENPRTNEMLEDDDGNAISIKLLGTDSKVWRNKNRENMRKRTAQMVRSKSKKVDFTVSDEDTCEMLSECTVDWKGIIDEGEEIEFSKEAAYELYMKYIWIREQVDLFVGDRANFFPSA
jgi:hypothetical protein